MMRLSIIASRAAVIMASFLLVSGQAQAQSRNSLAGRWTNVTLTELRSTDPRCRYAEAMTRAYDLMQSPNGMLVGTYSRIREIVSITEVPSCNANERKGGGDTRPRFDIWHVFEKSMVQGRVTIHGYKGECKGRCDDSVASDPEFEAILASDGKHLTDLEAGTSDPPLIFAPDQELEHDKRRAAEAYFKLLKPILRGDCKEFFNVSLDAAAQRTLPQESFCQLGAQMASLMPVIRVDRPIAAYAVTTGFLSPLAGKGILLGSGDVLVKRFFVVADDDSGILMAGILRKQADGGWRILSIAPRRRRAIAAQGIGRRMMPAQRSRPHRKAIRSAS
jgi:hypothetical protein